MGYCHIKQYPFSRQLCTIVLSCRKYEYQKLPMGLCDSPRHNGKTNYLHESLSKRNTRKIAPNKWKYSTHFQSIKQGTGWQKSMGWHIGIHHVRPKGYSTHNYSVHSCPTNIWTRFSNKSTSWRRQGNNKETKTNPY